MEFKGTKETWFKSGLEIVSMPSQVKIAKVSGANYEGAKANVLLISKAPEMLEMLIKLKDTLADGRTFGYNDYDRVEQLIKEATEL